MSTFRFNPKFSFSTMGVNGIVKTVKNSISKLGVNKIDLLQVNMGSGSDWYIGGRHALCKGIAQLHQEQLIGHVGLCNVYSNRMIESIYDELKEVYDIEIKTNVIPFSLLNYNKVNNQLLGYNTLQTCEKLNIKLFSSSPLGRGLCNGKYSKISPTGGKFIKQKKLSPFSFRRYDSYRGWKFGMDDLVAVYYICYIIYSCMYYLFDNDDDLHSFILSFFFKVYTFATSQSIISNFQSMYIYFFKHITILFEP
jgi:aryl-alcohol dehydrogenase-like predicted oxidoreductase